MNLNLEFFNRETNITAKVVADSISESGQRITTLEIEYPRFILAELNTHRALSKNSSSSRAIPINNVLEQIENNMAIPVYWGKQKAGMQATEEVPLSPLALKRWKRAFQDSAKSVEFLQDIYVHKQTSNRLLEPFQMMKTVITGTDWDNFFNLRLHRDAQPEICMLAYKIYKAMEESKPVELKVGEWHLPYVVKDNKFGYIADQTILTLKEAIKISASSCAAVSYRVDGVTLEKAEKIFDMLIKSDVIHSSPFEHLATPVQKEVEIENSDYMTVGFINKISDSATWEYGITHQRKDGKLCSGNLTGWISYRHQLSNNTCWEFDFEERMKMFDEGM